MTALDVDAAPMCVSCQEPIKVGQVVLCWNDEGETHANCNDPFSLTQIIPSEGNPAPVVLLGSPMTYVPLEAVTKIPQPHEEELLTAAQNVLSAFSEGVAWSDDQRRSYTGLHVAVSRFKPNLTKFQNNG